MRNSHRHLERRDREHLVLREEKGSLAAHDELFMRCIIYIAMANNTLPESFTFLQAKAKILYDKTAIDATTGNRKTVTDDEIGTYGTHLLNLVKELFKLLKKTQDDLVAEKTNCSTNTTIKEEEIKNLKEAALVAAADKTANEKLLIALEKAANEIATGPT